MDVLTLAQKNAIFVNMYGSKNRNVRNSASSKINPNDTNIRPVYKKIVTISNQSIIIE
jgi:hypothetical protein